VFDHVTIRASDREASERFYDTVLRTLGIEKTQADDAFAEWGDFSLTSADAETPVTQRLHVGFVAPSRAHVDAFWRAGTEAGYRSDGEPGVRAEYGPDYYGGFLLDPDGNSAEAVHHDSLRPGNVDHVWIRVADVEAARRFYETVGPHVGVVCADAEPGRVHFRTGNGSFSLVDGVPTEHVHMAFEVGDDAAVDAFHRAGTGAGHRDHGAPGARPEYHPGYYAAFVLDPDGNNIEAVNHNR
jgi:catechol 2,3-dioxygenase-like lactoylglutathione lyase family enzyme